MTSRKAGRLLAALAILALVVALFIKVIWIPLYEHPGPAVSERADDAGLQADVEREDSSGIRSWSVKDRQALTKLREGFRAAEFSAEKPPRADQRFRVKIRRSDARVDEYEVLVDESSSTQDMLYVVQRQGGSTVYGSALKTPELREALRQVLREPPAGPR